MNERLTRERDNARWQVDYMCTEIAKALDLPPSKPSDTVDAVRQIKAMADSYYSLRDRVRAAVAEHRSSQGPAATVPVWAIERALDGGEG